MKTLTINGRLWIYDPTKQINEDRMGDCEYSDVPLGGILHIAEEGSGQALMDTIIHEWLHALLPMAREEWVEENATSLAELLADRDILTRIGLFNNIHVEGKNE